MVSTFVVLRYVELDITPNVRFEVPLRQALRTRCRWQGDIASKFVEQIRMIDFGRLKDQEVVGTCQYEFTRSPS